MKSSSPSLVSNNSNLTEFVSHCSISQKIKSKKSSIKCTVCKSVIHKKCSKLQTKEIIDLKTTKPYTRECLLCLTHNLSFAACLDQENVVESFNFNFNCVCQINLPSDVKENKDKYIFKCSENDTTKDSNILDKNDNEFEKLSIDPKIMYYQNHEFHKLKQNLTKPGTFSTFHNNISSFNANNENLEILLTNLGHKFDIIALPKTWASDSKQNSLKSGTINGYQSYLGTTGTSMKSGCGFLSKRV